MLEEALIQAALQKKQDEALAVAAEEQAEKDFTVAQFHSIVTALAQTTEVMMKFLQNYEGKTKVTNLPTKIGTPDVDRVVKAVNHLEQALAPNSNDDIVTALQGVGSKIEAIPQTETVTVSNLTDLSSSLKDILATLKTLEMSPEINLPAPVVNVPETDLTPLVGEIKAVAKAVKAQVFPVANTPTDPLILYAPAHVDDAGAIQYFGYTQIGGAWYIRKFDTSVSPKTLTFAFGQYDYSTGVGTPYTTAWTNRATQTYAIWGT